MYSKSLEANLGQASYLGQYQVIKSASSTSFIHKLILTKAGILCYHRQGGGAHDLLRGRGRGQIIFLAEHIMAL